MGMGQESQSRTIDMGEVRKIRYDLEEDVSSDWAIKLLSTCRD